MISKVYTIHIDYLSDPENPSSYYLSMEYTDIAFTSLKKALSHMDVIKKALTKEGKQVLVSEADREFTLYTANPQPLCRRYYIRELKTV